MRNVIFKRGQTAVETVDRFPTCTKATEVIIDFDNTLFNATAFKHALTLAVRPYGCGEELFWKTYEQTKQTCGMYVPTKHAQLITQELGRVSMSGISSAIHQAIEQTSHCLYSDTWPFLWCLHEKGIIPTLLSFGETAWQKAKLAACYHMVNLFKQVIVTDQDKVATIDQLDGAAARQLVFLNDQPSEIKTIVETLPNAWAIQLVRPEKGVAPIAHKRVRHAPNLAVAWEHMFGDPAPWLPAG